MNRLALILLILSLLTAPILSYGQVNYLEYHNKVIECEKLVLKNEIPPAIEGFEMLLHQYDFVFLREIKLATELSVFIKDYESALNFVRLGIQNGWTLKSIRKAENLKPLLELQEWKAVESEYESLRSNYVKGLNLEVKETVHEMFKKDQKKASGALLKIGSKARDKYANKKFAPHSEEQLSRLNGILEQNGYPGEKLIGNNLWASVILCHHNSISVDYNSKDTLYFDIRPRLIEALARGDISPYEFAQIEDWRTAGLSGHNDTSYGFIGEIQNQDQLDKVNRNRSSIGMRSVDLRNQLIDTEESTKLNLYLPKGWQEGKITNRFSN